MSTTVRPLLLGLAAAALSCWPVRADFITIAQPDAAYLSSTTVLGFSDPDYTYVGFISGAGQTLSYDNLLEELTVPGSWTTWGSPPAVESATPRVGWTQSGVSELTISLSAAATTFGLEIDPDFPGPEPTTADFYSGGRLVGTIDLSPDASVGAMLFAASTTTNPFTRVVINNLTGDDFAIAQQRFILSPTSVPEPAQLSAVGFALLGLAVFRARNRACKNGPAT